MKQTTQGSECCKADQKVNSSFDGTRKSFEYFSMPTRLTVIGDCEFVSLRLNGDSISHLEEIWAGILPGDKHVIKHFHWQTEGCIKHMKISLPEHNIL